MKHQKWLLLLIFGCAGCEISEPLDLGDSCKEAIDYRNSDGNIDGSFDNNKSDYYGFIKEYAHCPADYSVCYNGGNSDKFCHKACQEGQIYCKKCINPNESRESCGAKGLCNDPDPESKNFMGYQCLCDNGVCNCGPDAHIYENSCEQDSVENCGEHGRNCLQILNVLTADCEQKKCVVKSCKEGTFFSVDKQSCITCEELVRDVSEFDTIKFGRYPQEFDNNEKQPLEWGILHVGDDKILMVSRYILQAREFHESNVEISWENSTIRSWLNGYKGESNQANIDYSNDSFINIAFNEEEQKCIQLFNRTENDIFLNDRVFLLSSDEVKNTNYFDNQSKRIAYVTGYATTGVFTSDTAFPDDCYKGRCAGPYWLRGPISECENKTGFCCAFVNTVGNISEKEARVNTEDPSHPNNIGVRPAIYLKK